MYRRSLLALLAAWPLSACASAQLDPEPPSAAPSLKLDPLVDLLPAGGLDWLLLLQPAELLREHALGKPLATVIPEANVDTLSTYLGFDPRLADQIAVAGYGESTLYALRVAHDPAQVETKFRERITSDFFRNIDGPSVTVLSGTIGSRRRSMADLDASVLLFESGPSRPLKAAIAFAQGKLKRARPALQVEPLATLARRLGPAPALLFAPASEAVPWRGAHGLLDRAAAVGLAASASPEGLRVRSVLLGAWDEPPTQALARLEHTLDDLAHSSVGRLTGLDAPRAPWSFGGDGEGIHAEGLLDPQKIADGLRAATSAGLRELFAQAPSP